MVVVAVVVMIATIFSVLFSVLHHFGVVFLCITKRHKKNDRKQFLQVNVLRPKGFIFMIINIKPNK